MSDKVSSTFGGNIKRGFIDSAKDFIAQIDIPGKDLTANAIKIFRGKVESWYRDFLNVKNDKTILPPELTKERDDLIDSGNRIIYIVEKMGIELKEEDFQNLGLAPVFGYAIAGTAAAGVLGYIATWYYKDRAHKRNLQVYTESIKSGASPEQALNTMRSSGTIGTSVFNDGTGLKLSTKLILGAVALGGLYLFLNKRQS